MSVDLSPSIGERDTKLQRETQGHTERKTETDRKEKRQRDMSVNLSLVE